MQARPRWGRQLCSLNDIFTRYELPHDSIGTIVFPVYYNNIIYGLLLCDCEQSICEKGEFITLQLGQAVSSAVQ